MTEQFEVLAVLCAARQAATDDGLVTGTKDVPFQRTYCLFCSAAFIVKPHARWPPMARDAPNRNVLIKKITDRQVVQVDQGIAIKVSTSLVGQN